MKTIYNTQVDCTNLSAVQIHELAKGLKIWDFERSLIRFGTECFFAKFESDNEFYMRTKSATKTIVSFDEFIKLKAL